jgi:poly-beta-hydroxybutyrate-responsive repressor
MHHLENVEITHSPVIVSLLEPVLLFMIKQHPRHGYSLLADLEAIKMGTIQPGVVYRTLHELEALGWIASQWDTDQTQGPPRRTYSLTSNGESALDNWRDELQKVQQIIADLLK